MWWLLIVTRWPAGEADAFDYVGIERALGEEIGAADLAGFFLEDVDEGLADQLALGLGLVESGEAGEEALRGVHVDERDVVMVAEQRDDLLGLVGAHQAVIDEDAGELKPDRLVDQHRGDGAVDAAGEAADDAALAYLRADIGELGLPIFRHRPVAGQAADVADEIGEQFAAVRRVHDLGVKHQGEEAALLIGGDGEGRAFGRRDDAEAFGQSLDPVAMAHPDLVLLAGLPETVEQHGFAGNLDERAPELALVRRRDPAAELVRHGLLAVADGEYGEARVEEMLRRARTVVPHHRGGAAGEDDALRLEPFERLVRPVERRDLAIHPRLAHPPRDQLGHLAAEIDDKDGVGMRRHGRAIAAPAPL